MRHAHADTIADLCADCGADCCTHRLADSRTDGSPDGRPDGLAYDSTYGGATRIYLGLYFLDFSFSTFLPRLFMRPLTREEEMVDDATLDDFLMSLKD